jgi:hypothetical protein
MTIPAMTSPAEQACFHKLAREQAPYGAVVELGAWLGACTAAIASGIKLSGVPNVVHSYDRFKWNARSHGLKAGFQVDNLFNAYRENIAPLAAYVRPHKGEISEAQWNGGPISLLVCDAPKRFGIVQHALSEFGVWLRPHSVMAWQDFCFPPAYAIAACLYRLREHLSYREFQPLCTVVFDVKSAWHRDDVALAKLEGGWSVPELAQAVDYWNGVLPQRAYAGVACGLAMFMSDLGYAEAGKALVRQSDPAPLQRIRQTHPRLRLRYEELFRGL